jgi:hypothetical protein
LIVCDFQFNGLVIYSKEGHLVFIVNCEYQQSLPPTARAWRVVAAFGKRPARTGASIKLQKMKIYFIARAYPSPETDAAG